MKVQACTPGVAHLHLQRTANIQITEASRRSCLGAWGRVTSPSFPCTALGAHHTSPASQPGPMSRHTQNACPPPRPQRSGGGEQREEAHGFPNQLLQMGTRPPRHLVRAGAVGDGQGHPGHLSDGARLVVATEKSPLSLAPELSLHHLPFSSPHPYVQGMLLFPHLMAEQTEAPRS